MNLVQLSRLLVEQSGLQDLVEDAAGGDYSPNSALLSNSAYFLNAGLRLINRRWESSGTKRRFIHNLAAGSYAFSVPHLDAAKFIDYSDGVTRKRLTYVLPHQLREMYPEPYDIVESDTPMFWTYNEGRSTSSVPILADGGLTTAPTETNTNITSDAGAALMYAAPNTWFAFPSAAWAYSSSTQTNSYIPNANGAYMGRYVGQDYESGVSITIVAETVAQSIGVAVGYFNGTSFTAIDSSSTLLTGSGTVSFTPSITWNCLYIMAASAGTFSTPAGTLNFIPVADGQGSISSVYATVGQFQDIDDLRDTDDKQIIIMPRPDAAYTYQLFGDFKTANLSADTDSNWWTENHPELVIRGARVQLELDGHRNISGMTGFLGQLEAELERMHAQDMFCMISSLTPEQACLNG